QGEVGPGAPQHQVGLLLVEGPSLVAPARGELERGDVRPRGLPLFEDGAAGEPRKLVEDTELGDLPEALALGQRGAADDEGELVTTRRHLDDVRGPVLQGGVGQIEGALVHVVDGHGSRASYDPARLYCA